jgi:predicted transcriptional regulator
MTAGHVSDEFRISRLTGVDASSGSDDYARFRDLVMQNEPSYPGIQRWLNGKVAEGLRTSERAAFVAYLNDRPVASAVVKRGEDAKFCHLRLDHGIRDQNLGEVFFCLMAGEARRYAKDIHFTLPESLWAEKADFFKSFGFTTASRARTQYRLFEDELRCSAAFVDVWRAVLEKLPKLGCRFSIHGRAMRSALVMSIAPKFASRIFEGGKWVEVRRRFSKRWIGSRAAVYASTPAKQLLGETVIANVVEDTPEEIWAYFGEAIGCTWSEYRQYVGTAREISAIILDDVVPYLEPIPLSHLEHLIQKDLDPPQSYCSAQGAWSEALSIAALLHGGSRSVRPVHTPKLNLPPTSQLSLLYTGHEDPSSSHQEILRTLRGSG